MLFRSLLKAVEQALTKQAPPARVAMATLQAQVAPMAIPVGTLQADAMQMAPAAMGGQQGTGLVTAQAVQAGLQARQLFELDKPLREARDEFEKCYFEFHLAKEGGSMTRVAEKTGLERTHLYRKLKQLGVDLSRGKRGG